MDWLPGGMPSSSPELLGGPWELAAFWLPDGLPSWLPFGCPLAFLGSWELPDGFLSGPPDGWSFLSILVDVLACSGTSAFPPLSSWRPDGLPLPDWEELDVTELEDGGESILVPAPCLLALSGVLLGVGFFFLFLPIVLTACE
jgi:hypothetical protein